MSGNNSDAGLVEVVVATTVTAVRGVVNAAGNTVTAVIYWAVVSKKNFAIKMS